MGVKEESERYGGKAKRAIYVPPILGAGGKVILTTAAISRIRAACAADDSSESDHTWRIVKAATMVVSLIAGAGLLSLTMSAGHPMLASWFTLLPLLVAIRVLTPKKALGCGLLWGGSLFAFLGLSADPAILLTLQSLALLSAVPAVYAFAGSWFTRRFGFNPLILGFGWAGVELALIPLGLDGGLLAGGRGFAVGGIAYVLYNLVGSVCMASFIAVAGGLLIALAGRVCAVVAEVTKFEYSMPERGRLVYGREVPALSFIPTSPARPRAPPIS